MKWDCDNIIEQIIKNGERNVRDHIEMIYMQAISKPKSKDHFPKELNQKMIEDFLKRRGYVINHVSGRMIMVNKFTCVYIGKNYVEVWHDIKGSKSVFIKDSLLTGLPITLNYMERI